MDKADTKRIIEALMNMCKASATVLKASRKKSDSDLDEAISLLRQANGETVGVLRSLKTELQKYGIDLE